MDSMIDMDDKYDYIMTVKEEEDLAKEVARIQKGGKSAINLFLKSPKLVERYNDKQLTMEYLVATDLTYLHPKDEKIRSYYKALKEFMEKRKLTITTSME